jgi:hypothetical protein
MGTDTKEKLEAALQRVRQAYHKRILVELQNTQRTYKQIATDIGVSESLVYTLSRIHSLSRSRTAPEQMVGEKE